MVRSMLKNLVSFIKSVPAFVCGTHSFFLSKGKEHEEAIRKVFNVRYLDGKLVAEDCSPILFHDEEVLHKYFSAL